MERYYPTTEKFLNGLVRSEDYWDFVFKGFSLLKINGEECYVSYNFNRETLAIKRTKEMEIIMVSTETGKSVISNLVRLAARLKHIQIHHIPEDAWNLVKNELEKVEYHNEMINYPITINVLVHNLFPNYPY